MFLLSISCSTFRFRHSEQSESLHTLRTEILYQIWKCGAFSNKVTLGWTIPLLRTLRSTKCELLECRVPEHREDLTMPLRTEGSASLKLSREHGAPLGAAEGARCSLVPCSGKAGTVLSLTATHRPGSVSLLSNDHIGKNITSDHSAAKEKTVWPVAARYPLNLYVKGGACFKLHSIFHSSCSLS